MSENDGTELEQIKARYSAIDTVQEEVDDLDASGGDYALAIVPHRLNRAQQDSVADVPRLVAALESVEAELVEVDRTEGRVGDRLHPGVRYLRDAIRTAIDHALTPGEDAS